MLNVLFLISSVKERQTELRLGSPAAFCMEQWEGFRQRYSLSQYASNNANVLPLALLAGRAALTTI